LKTHAHMIPMPVEIHDPRAVSLLLKRPKRTVGPNDADISMIIKSNEKKDDIGPDIAYRTAATVAITVLRRVRKRLSFCVVCFLGL